MKTLMRIFNRPISNDHVDGSFSFWSCAGGAVGVFILATVYFGRHSQSLLELTCGLGLTLATCLILFWTGVSTSQLHFALLKHKLPVRSRLAEFAGYVATMGILFAGVLYLPSLALERTGMTMALLLILTASMSAACLGTWFTLRAAAKLTPVNPSIR